MRPIVSLGTYQPLSRPEFIYINAVSAKQLHIQDFVKFYLDNATSLVDEVGYIPLPKEVYENAYIRFMKGKTGSLFENKSVVGVNLLEILKEE